MTYLISILARALALVDAYLSNFTTPVVALPPAGCGVGMLNVTLNSCGQEFVNLTATVEIAEKAFQILITTALSAGHF